MGSSVEIVNIVSSTNLGKELDLEAVANSYEINELDEVASVELNQESGRRILMRLDSIEPLGIISRKGSFIITGSHSFGELNEATETFKRVFREV
ncbi:MAG: hypothetical protein BRC56_00970, partial [Cyanobacteria bacterium SW_9_47_5]